MGGAERKGKGVREGFGGSFEWGFLSMVSAVPGIWGRLWMREGFRTGRMAIAGLYGR